MDLFDRLAGALSLAPSTVGAITVLLVFLFGFLFGWKFRKWALVEEIESRLNSRTGIRLNSDLCKDLVVLNRANFDAIDMKADLWDEHHKFVHESLESAWIVEVQRESRQILEMVRRQIKSGWPRYEVWMPTDGKRIEMRKADNGEWLKLNSDLLEILDRPLPEEVPSRPKRPAAPHTRLDRNDIIQESV